MKGQEKKKESKKEKAEPGRIKVQSEYQKEKGKRGESVLNTKLK